MTHNFSKKGRKALKKWLSSPIEHSFTMKHPLHLFEYCPRCGCHEFVVNDEKSKRCGKCGFVFYFNAAAATVAFILNDRNELLVARRAKEPAKGTLDLPGGFVDSMETGEEGVARELREETGLHIAGAEYLFSLPNVYLYSGFEVHTLDLFYLCRVGDYSGIEARDDVADLQWMALSETNPEQFGLQSVRKGVERFISEFQKKNN